MSGILWSKVFHAMAATPISVRDIAVGNLAWIAARLTMISAVFTLVIIAFGAAATATILSGFDYVIQLARSPQPAAEPA